MIYIDASCLVKLFRPEPNTIAVVEALGRESAVVISSLAELETLIQLKAGYLGGDYNLAKWRSLEAQLGALRNMPPYEFRALPAALFQTALRQHRNSEQAHCRTLDRLHLAAMEELKLKRLMTRDARQAAAAASLGFEVLQPGR